MPDDRLHWTVGEIGPLHEITHSGVLPDLAAGQSHIVTVDHRDEAVFGLASPPVFTVPDGVLVRFLCGPVALDGVPLADGDGFVVEVVNVSYSQLLSPPYGTPGIPDVPYSWTRRGVLK